jgi:WD40 repeat protein
MKSVTNSILLTLAAIAGFLTQAKPASNQPQEHQRRASQWDYATAERLFRKGAWREGVAYLGRALGLDPQNSAAARDLWNAVVYGEGDRNTVPALVLQQEAKIHVAVLSPDGRRILTASADKTARLWDATTGMQIGEPMRHEDEVVDAAFSPDGARIATASRDRTARLWDATTLKPVGQPMRHDHPVAQVAFNSTGTRIVTDCDEADLLRLWDAAAGAPVGEAMPDKSNYARGTWGFSPDGKLLTTIEDRTLHTWDSATGKSLGKPLRFPSEVKDIAISPDRKRAVTMRSGKVQVWNVTTGKILHTLPIRGLDDFDRASAAFSPNGKRIATVFNWSVQLWDAETGKRVGTEHACASSDAEGGASTTFSPDSMCFLIDCSDSRDDKFVSAWNCETSEPFDVFSPRLLPPILQHPEEVYGVEFTDDGSRVVTTCQDHVVRVWDAEKGVLIGQPLRHAYRSGDGIERIAVSPGGRRILTVDAQNTLRVWQVDEPRLIDESLLPVEQKTMAPAGAPPEAFIEALSGYRFTDDGVLHEIADTETAALRARLRAPAENASEWQPLITWWLTAPQDRPLCPGDKLTRRERADQELAKGTWQGISNAYALDPTHPLVHIAMAKEAHKKRDAFLRAYGIARLPVDPAIRACAAEMLTEQSQPDLAQKVMAAKPVR